MDLKRGILHALAGKVDPIGFAPADRFANAPDEHHPSQVCKDARTIIVFGKVVPRSAAHFPHITAEAFLLMSHTILEERP